MKDSKRNRKAPDDGGACLTSQGGATPCVTDEMLENLASESRREKQMLRWAVAFACLLHGILLSITLPSLGARPTEFHRESKIFVLQQPRFKLPPPPRGGSRPPERRTKKIPIPDPTPDAPEPILDPEITVPEIELPDLSPGVFGIPDAPPGPPGSPFGSGEGPFHLGGKIQPPEKVFAPEPPYTEDARLARIQGLVLLETVIDEEGNVTQIKVLKDLPLGLTESALETIATWKFKPATRDGEPVAVYYHLSVRFSVI